MLRLRDFHHLEKLDGLIDQIRSSPPGLILVAGAGVGQPHISEEGDLLSGSRLSFLPSGRSTIASIIFHELLDLHQNARAVIVTQDRDSIRIPRVFRNRVTYSTHHNLSLSPDPFAHSLALNPDILFVDIINGENNNSVVKAAAEGKWVIAQTDTVQWGPVVAGQLFPEKNSSDFHRFVRAVITVQRLPGLCQYCKQPVPDHLVQSITDQIIARYHHLAELLPPQPGFYQSGKCDRCKFTGRSGNVSLFDVYMPKPEVFTFTSDLSLEEYLFQMVVEGLLAPDDLIWLEQNLLGTMYSQLRSQQQNRQDTEVTLQAKLLELEAANRVLLQRTEVLMSLEDFGHALISSTDLYSLANLVCRRTAELCGADRVVLYLNKSVGDKQVAEVIAVNGWKANQITYQLDSETVFGKKTGKEPKIWNNPPPGIAVMDAEKEAKSLKTGLRLPLLTQDQYVGLMIVHSTQKGSFTPGEIALLQTFGNQAAVAIQRAGLIEELRQKIVQLEAAQVELVKKERMDQELALARQVQQSMLPRQFPHVEGLFFTARNEPARQVGGDFYDVFQIPENRLGIVIADVSDKGMPAALYMALSRSLIQAEARRGLSPKQTLENVNNLLLELGEPDNFVSVFYGELDPTNLELVYSRAGHDHPVLIRSGQLESLPGKGTVLGILETENLNLSEEKIRFQPGDLLVLYTDGVVDLSNPKGQSYGQERFITQLIELSEKSPATLCEDMFNALIEFQSTAIQFDDMTLLVIGFSK